MEIQMAGRAGEKSSLSGISIVSILPFRTSFYVHSTFHDVIDSM